MVREVTSGSFDHILVLGCGHMGGALVSRWGDACLEAEQTGTGLPKLFSVIDRSPNAVLGSAPLLPPRFQAYARLQDFAQSDSPPADALLLAVRPQQILAALASALDFLSPYATIMSLAAGLPLARLRVALGATFSLFRVMPSIPVAIGEGVLLISSDGQHNTEGNVKGNGEGNGGADSSARVRGLFAPMGRSVFCSDELLDKGTGLWGSAPGYLFQMIEAFEAAACKLGYEPEQARLLAFQTIKGVGIFADQQRAEKNLSPEELVASIALPGGTTEAGLRVLKDKDIGLVALMQKASELAYQRAEEMAQENVEIIE